MIGKYPVGTEVSMFEGDGKVTWTVDVVFEVDGNTYLAMHVTDYPEEGVALWRVDEDDTFVEMIEDDDEGALAWDEFERIVGGDE